MSDILNCVIAFPPNTPLVEKRKVELVLLAHPDIFWKSDFPEKLGKLAENNIIERAHYFLVINKKLCICSNKELPGPLPSLSHLNYQTVIKNY